MAYTFVSKPAATSANANDNFGGVPVDANHLAIGKASGIQTSDAAATPNKSPLTVGTTQTVITVPLNAATMVITPATAVNVSEVTASPSFYTIPAGVTMTLDVARMNNVYLSTATGTSVVSFFFQVI